MKGPASGVPSTEVLDYLAARRSLSIKKLGEPGPTLSQIETILDRAMRVPDHGKLAPWHFIVLTGESRREAGDLLYTAYQQDEDPDAATAKLDMEAQRFLRAPAVIAVVSRIRSGKKVAWEQILSAGAACQNLVLAANASGFATNWVTEWYSYSPAFKTALGLDERDHIAGFIYIGTAQEQPEERKRPAPEDIVTWWSKGSSLNKGDHYGKAKKGLPPAGMDFSFLDRQADTPDGRNDQS